MSLYSELDNLDLQELIAYFHGPPLDGEEYGFIYYGEVAVCIRHKGEAGLRFLLDEIGKTNEDQLRAILLALTYPPQLKQPGLSEMLLACLEDKRPFIVAQAIDGLWLRGEKAATDKVLALQNHPDPFIRGSVLRFMRHLHPETATPMLIQALQDPDFVVRENGVDELDELGVVEALPYIRPLLKDPHEDVREAAQTAVENLENLAAQNSQPVSTPG